MSIPQTPSPLSNILAAKTYNAAWFSGSTKEIQITNAIAAAVTDGATHVYLPSNMLGYSPASVTFNNAVHLIREGTDPTVYDVMSYGAVGNGIADDTLAIQTAINAVAAVGVGKVWIPLITCLISSTLNVPSNVIIDGVGTIRTNSGFKGLRVNGGSNIKILGITVDGAQVGANDPTSHLISIESGTDVLVRDVQVLNARSCGFLVLGGSRITLEKFYLYRSWNDGIEVAEGAKDVTISNFKIIEPGYLNTTGTNGKGISILSLSSSVENTTISNGLVFNQKIIGVEIFGSAITKNVKITNVEVRLDGAVTGTNQFGFSFENGQHATVTGCYASGCSLGFEAADTSLYIEFIGCHARPYGSKTLTQGFSISGITPKGISIIGGVVDHPTSFGVQIISGSHHKIIGLVVDTPGDRGIYLNNFGANAFCRIQDCTVINGVLSGIYVLNTYDCIIRDNIAKGNNTSSTINETDIFINVSTAAFVDTLTVQGNTGTVIAFDATDTLLTGLMRIGGFKKIVTTVSNVQTTIAHGLAYVPSKIIIKPKANAIIWESATADATNIYLTASVAASAAHVYVA